MRQIKLLLPLLVLLLLPTLSRADSFSLPDQLKTLPLKEGVTWDYKHHRFLNTLGIGIVGYDPIGIDLDFIGTDGAGATLSVDLSKLPVQNVMILKYLSYLNVGYTVGVRTLTLTDVDENPASDNQFIHGPTIFAKFNF